MENQNQPSSHQDKSPSYQPLQPLYLPLPMPVEKPKEDKTKPFPPKVIVIDMNS